MIEKFTNLLENREYSRVIQSVIIGLTILDVVLLTGTLFFPVSTEVYNYIVLFDLLVVVILATQFMYNLYNSDNRINFIKLNWFDLVGMVPEILLGGYSAILRYFRLIKIFGLLNTSLGNFLKFVEKAHLEYGIVTLIFILISGASIFYFFEFGVNQNVNSLDDALWYILITITTVGFGDIYPQTVGGRIATLIIIVAGIAFVSFAAFKITKLFFEESEEKEIEIEGKLDELEGKMDKIQSELDEIKNLLKKEIE